MIGTVVQYLLYGVLWFTTMLIISGVYQTIQARRGADVDLEPYVSGLSLIAAAAPYLGLFGTVWHIIQALSGIGTGNLSVAAISQPIGEALYQTLWGLGCAIPALIGHRAIMLYAPLDDEQAEVVEAEVVAEATATKA